MAVPGHRLDRMFNPRSVVVIGDKGPGYMWLNSNRRFSEMGGALYSVQLDEREIPGIEKLGVQNFTALDQVPGEIDYAIVAVPRQVAPLILKGLIDKGAHGATFFTSGFAETGQEEGIALQQQLTEMARAAGFNLVGPNCMGLYLPKYGVLFSNGVPVCDDGRIAFLSQSGTHGIAFAHLAAANGMHLSRCVSLGNAIALDLPDYLDYMMQDPETEVIGMYVEGVRDGRRFFEALRAACKVKPVVVWKGGQTDAGARATMSHTASLATSQAIWEGMIRQCGAIGANNLDETVDAIKAITMAKPPAGRRMALLAMTGGQSVSITDAFAKGGFEVPRLTQESYRQLAEFFNVIGGSYQNPLDMAGTMQGRMDTLERMLHIVEADAHIDAVAMEASATYAARLWKRNPESLDRLLDTLATYARQSPKPFILVMHPAHEAEYVASIQHKFSDRGLPAFPSFERAAAALDRAARAVGV